MAVTPSLMGISRSIKMTSGLLDLGQVICFQTIGGLTNDNHIWLYSEQCRQSFTDYGMIIND